MLSLEQEQFLHEFYALCKRYQQAGVVACSHGQTQSGYELALLLQTTSRKDPDGLDLDIEFRLSTGAIKLGPIAMGGGDEKLPYHRTCQGMN
jgi:hypothetical protein